MKNIDRRNFIHQAGSCTLAIGNPIPTLKNVPLTYREVTVEKTLVCFEGSAYKYQLCPEEKWISFSIIRSSG